MKRDPIFPILIAGSIILLAVGPFLPRWVMFLINVSLCYGIVVLGMLLLMRTGVVSFGHGLYYCLGAYAAGTLDQVFKISDMAVMLVAAVVVTALASAALDPNAEVFTSKPYRIIENASDSMAKKMSRYLRSSSPSTADARAVTTMAATSITAISEIL